MSPRNRDLRDLPVLSLSQNDYLDAKTLCQGGTLILGDPGSGKSSTSRKAIICGLMRAGFGGLFCTTKPEDTADYLAFARECGREDDVIVFSHDSGLSYDAIAYEWEHTTGKGAKDVETIVDFMDVLLSLGKNYSGGGDTRFFELAAQQLTRHAGQIIKLADERMSIPNLSRAISSFPTYLGEEDDKRWQERSYTYQLVNAIRQRGGTLTEDEWQDLEAAAEFIFKQWAKLDERPRSSIAMTFGGTADRFLFNPAKKLFASGTYSFTPWDITHKAKLVILDFAVNERGREGARLYQSMIKLSCQRDWLRHPYVPGCCNGGMIVQDEFQFLITKFENFFAQTVRSSLVAPLYITQNILNLSEELGEQQPGSKTKAFLANLGVKIAHRCTCPETGTYLADVFGKSYAPVGNYGTGSSDSGQGHVNVGGSLQLKHLLDPIEFTRLARPSGQSPIAAAYVWCGGEIFNATRTEKNPSGANFLKAHFSRD